MEKFAQFTSSKSLTLIVTLLFTMLLLIISGIYLKRNIENGTQDDIDKRPQNGATMSKTLTSQQRIVPIPSTASVAGSTKVTEEEYKRWHEINRPPVIDRH